MKRTKRIAALALSAGLLANECSDPIDHDDGHILVGAELSDANPGTREILERTSHRTSDVIQNPIHDEQEVAKPANEATETNNLITQFFEGKQIVSRLESNSRFSSANPFGRITPLSNTERNEMDAYLYDTPANDESDNGNVLRWQQEHASFWNTVYPTMAAYSEAVPSLIDQGLLTSLAEDTLNTAYFNPYSGGDFGSGVTQDVRRVIRTVDRPILDEVALRLNSELRERGMSPDYFITPVINSTVRDEHTNRQIGGSPNSLHRFMSAIDWSERYFILNTRQPDGTVLREYAQADSTYLDILSYVMYEVAQDGIAFVRRERENPHFHISPMVPVDAQGNPTYSSNMIILQNVTPTAGTTTQTQVENVATPENAANSTAEQIIATNARMFATNYQADSHGRYAIAYYLTSDRTQIVATRKFYVSGTQNEHVTESGTQESVQDFHDSSRADTSLLTIERPDLMPNSVTETSLPTNVSPGGNINIETIRTNFAANSATFIDGWRAQYESDSVSSLRGFLTENNLEQEFFDHFIYGVIPKESAWDARAGAGTTSAQGLAQVVDGTARTIINHNRGQYGIQSDNRFDPYWSGRATVANMDLILEHGNNREDLQQLINLVGPEFGRDLAVFLLGQAHHAGQGRLAMILSFALENYANIQANSVNSTDFYFKIINAFYDNFEPQRASEETEGRIDLTNTLAFRIIFSEVVPPAYSPETSPHQIEPQAVDPKIEVASIENLPERLLSPSWNGLTLYRQGRGTFPSGVAEGRTQEEYNGQLSVKIEIPRVPLGEFVTWLTGSQHTSSELKEFNGLSSDQVVSPGTELYIPISWME